MEFTSYGSYRLGAMSGLTTAIAANGPMMAMRWGNTTGVCARVTRIKVGVTVATAFTVAQFIGFDIVIGRGWTVGPSGGSAVTLTTNSTKLRALSPTTRLSAAQVANTAALTAGTLTLDANAIETEAVFSAGLAAGATVSRTYDFNTTEAGGIILAQDEGILIRNSVLMVGVGAVQWVVSAAWDEGTCSP